MRLFFGMEVIAPWPESKMSAHRHLTLAFLGSTTMPDLNSFPKPPFQIGLAGIFDQPFHPNKHVFAWHIQWLEEGLFDYQKELNDWLKIPSQEFLPHVTMERAPFKEKIFESLPLYVKDIHLYESLGNSQYKILWTYPLLAPFEEIDHTADIAFRVRGNLYLHAQLALSFQFPPFIRYFDFKKIDDLEEIISALNVLIARADSEIGCPFKAVSFHGEIDQNKEWEMIVDV